ncbi:50S ribosomal protein L32 [bacterium]|nr:50S ribosomal protein L32 [bacterium]
MSVRMRVNRSHTGNRRSHHALKEPRLSKCAKCGAQHLRHRMCPECGNYRGREVVDVAGKKAARMVRREERLKAMGEDPQAEAQEKEEEAKAEKKETKKKAAKEEK